MEGLGEGMAADIKDEIIGANGMSTDHLDRLDKRVEPQPHRLFDLICRADHGHDLVSPFHVVGAGNASPQLEWRDLLDPDPDRQNCHCFGVGM